MTSQRLLLILSVTCSLFFTYSISADSGDPADEDNFQQLLSKMNQTLERGNYEGVFVFMQNGNVETMSIVHGYTDTGVREKLVSLNWVMRAR